MKRFTFIIVDDEISPETGYLRFIKSFLKPYNYLNFEAIRFDEKGWNNDNELSMHLKVLTHKFMDDGSGSKYCFSTALKYFRENEKLFDFFVCDLQFKDNPMDPTHTYNNCSESKKYRDIPSYSADENNKSIYIAGLSFILSLPIDKRPKFIYSAKEDTKDFRTHTRLWQERLQEIYIVDRNVQGTATSDDIKRAENALDDYLSLRQLKIINRLDPDKRASLKSRVEQNIELELDDIPDENTPEDKWSLFSLFPKQYNIIKQNSAQCEQAKKYILRIIEADWQILMRSLFFHPASHPHYGFITKYSNLKYPTKLIRDLDFQVIGQAQNYKRLTDLPIFRDPDLDNINYFDVLYKNIRSNTDYHSKYMPFMEKSLTLTEYFNKFLNDKDQTLMLLHNMCRIYGVYPIDISYISHIANQNICHADGRKPTFSYSPYIPGDNGPISFIWEYNHIAPSEIFNQHSKLYAKLSDAIKAPTILTDEGYSNIWKIICWRYNGTLEFYSGRNKITSARDGKIDINTSLSEYHNKTVLKVSIPLPKEI